HLVHRFLDFFQHGGGQVVLDALELLVEGGSVHGSGQVAALGVDQQAHRGGWQYLADLQFGRGRALNDINGFYQYGAFLYLLVLEQAYHRAAFAAGEHHIHGVTHHGVIPGQEFDVFPAQCHGPLVGGADTVFRQGGEAVVFQAGAGADQDDGVGQVFFFHAIGAEYLLHVVLEERIVVAVGHVVQQFLHAAVALGEDFQQTVAAVHEAFVQFGDLGLGGLDQTVEGVVVLGQGGQEILETGFEHDAVAGLGLVEGGKAFNEPFQKALLPGFAQRGGVDLYAFLLADPVESADALFQLVDGGGQVEH